MDIASLSYVQRKAASALENGILHFHCDREPDMVNFLRERASLFEAKAKSRTYLLLDEEALHQGKIRIVAFFSLAPQVMFVPPDLSVRQVRRLDGFSGKIHGRKIEALPAVLIGQLAKEDHFAESITGHEILAHAWNVIGKAHAAIGGRIVMVDVKSSAEGLIRFYERENFKFISQSEETGLSQLIYMLSG